MPRPARKADLSPAADPETTPLGFRGWEEDQEARLERPASARANPDALVAVARVVYLGSARRKTVVRPGGLTEMQREDDTLFHIPAPTETDQNIAYDFSKLDTRGRRIETRMTEDQHPFAICRHIGHLAWFYEQADGEDRSPVFELRAPPATLQRVKAYIESTRRNIAANREHPVNILSAMEREGAEVWSAQGGEVGTPVA